MKANMSGIDPERLVLVPIFSFLLFMNMMGIYDFVSEQVIVDHLFVMSVLHKLTLICFYLFIVALFFRRAKVLTATKSASAQIMAYTGTFLPFSLTFIGYRSTTVDLPRMLNLLSTGIMLLSMFFAVYSLKSLGKGFGIVPQARALSRSGPYRYIRHPLYTFEILAFGAAIIPVFSIASLSILVALICVQVYRATEEEKILERSFPEYKEYRGSTKRFIPGLV